MNRLDQLLQFLQEEPDDPFNLYALALEYQKTDKIKAKALFDQLLLRHESYLPVYYHAGALYMELNSNDRALQIFEKGIEEAKRQHDPKAMRELQTLRDELI